MKYLKILQTISISVIALTMVLNYQNDDPIIYTTINNTTQTTNNYSITVSHNNPIGTIKNNGLSETDKNLLALVVMAEAEGESTYGKRLVIDTILNRVDSKKFPDTISGVIYHKNQFSAMWNGRINKVEVDNSIKTLVQEELNNRTNDRVLYFTAGKYGKYGTPSIVEGNHYFSQ